MDCWGAGNFGQLGNGTFYGGFSGTRPTGSATPVQVEGVGGTGTLTGVTSVTGDKSGSSCAIVASGGVDCWGYGYNGQLGNGVFYTTSPNGSATPVQVEGVGGTGTLTGVTSLTSDGYGYDFCAVLASGGVDCWGNNEYGQLGNGTVSNSATPVPVEGVGGAGTLTGVASLTSDTIGTYCALLTSGAVDCWGWGEDGELGNGTFDTTSPYGTATPVQVEGVGGGTLTGVEALANDDIGFCALLTTGEVNCWGINGYGALGNGTFSNSATPVPVEGVAGTGTLTGVESLIGGWNTYCAIFASGGVDCWGFGGEGGLGNGTVSNSATPVPVEGVGGAGTLTGVASLTSDTIGTYCALLTSGAVDCWGWGEDGELGNGTFDTTSPYGTATPVQVEGVGGGTLTGVTSVVGEVETYCATLASGGVDCWGYDDDGELGNGTVSDSATPVPVLSP